MVDVVSSADVKALLARKLNAPPGTPRQGQVVAVDSSSTTGTSWVTPATGGSGTGTVPDATTTTNGAVRLAGDLAGTAAAPTLRQLNAAAQTYGTSTAVPRVTVDVNGRVSSAVEVALQYPPVPPAIGAAAGIVALAGDLDGPATAPQLAPVGVPAGRYALADLTSITFDSKGRAVSVVRAVSGQDATYTVGGTQPTVTATVPQATHVWVTQPGIAAYTKLSGTTAPGGFVAYPTGDQVEAYVDGGTYIARSNHGIDWSRRHVVTVSYDAVTGFVWFTVDGQPWGTYRDTTANGWTFTGSGTLTANGVDELRRWPRNLHGRELRQVVRALAVQYAVTPAQVIGQTTATPLARSGLKGFNQHPKAVQFSGGYNVYEQFWGAQWDWAWVKDSIDRTYARGGRLYRVVGDVQGVKAGTITQAAYTARLTQLADYVASRGMYLYYCGADLKYRGDCQASDLTGQYTAAAAVLQAHAANVFGFDLANEIRSTYATTPKATLGPWLQAAATAVRAAAPDVPLTVSDVGGGGGDDGGTAGGVLSRAGCYLEYAYWAPYVDFFDVHAYEDVVGELRSWHLAPYTFAIDRPVVLGEFGADLTNDGAGAAFVGRVEQLRLGTQGCVAVAQWAARNDVYGVYKESDGTVRPLTAAAFDQIGAG